MSDDAEANAGKQVIARAAAILRTLENRKDGRTIADLVRATGLPRTTVQRMVVALETQQLVSAVAGTVRLGPALARLAASAHTDIISLARPHVEAAGRLTRETVNIFVARGEHAILVDQYVSDQELRVVSPVGAALPLYCTAHGKALLADMSDADIAACLPSAFEAHTARTVTSLAQLIAQIGTIRMTGIAEDIGEHVEGVSGVGVALRTATPERYGLSIAAPAHRFDGARDRVTAALIRCRSAIEASLGFA